MQTIDKFKTTLTNPLEFVQGEQPAPTKLNIGFQGISAALAQLEGAVGPIRDSGANPLSNYPLRISNVARFLGPSHGVQCRIQPGATYVVDAQLETARASWKLPVWPWTTDTSGNPVGPNLYFEGDFLDERNAQIFYTDVGQGGELAATGDYTYNGADNCIYSFSKLHSVAGTLHMTTLQGIEGVVPIEQPYLNYAPYGNAWQNVIPHPSHAPATSVVVTQSSPGIDGAYLITICPETAVQNSPVIGIQGQTYGPLDIGAAVAIITDEYGIAPNYIGATEYIPQELPPFLTALSADDPIPQGIVTLFKDASTQAYDSLHYVYADQTSLYVYGGNLATGDGYRVMCAGADISESIENAIYTIQHHRHRGGNSIPHNHIVNAGYQRDTQNLWLGWYGRGWDRPQNYSLIPGNYHPQYLMRNGYSEGDDPTNLDNAMLGPLYMGFAAGTYATATNVCNAVLAGSIHMPSHPIVFGDTTDGASIQMATEYQGTSFLSLLSPRSRYFGQYSDCFAISWFGTNNEVSVLGDGAAGLAINLQQANDCFVQVAGTGINAINASPAARDMKMGLYGRDLVLRCSTSTSCVNELYGSDIGCTATNLKFSQCSLHGQGLKVTMPSDISGFIANIIGSDNAVVVDLAGDPDVLDYSFYFKGSNWYADVDLKQVNMPLDPAGWLKSHEEGGPGTASVYYNWNSLADVEVFSTCDAAQSLFQFLHLPPDAQLDQLKFVMDRGTASFYLFEAGTGAARYYLAASSVGQGPTGGRGVYTWNLASTHPGRKGNRFPTYGHTGYDVLVVVDNDDAALGMTAYLGEYTYKPRRI